MGKNPEDENFDDYFESEEINLPQKIEKAYSKHDEIKRKQEKLDSNKFKKLFLQVRLALELLKDYKKGIYRELPWRSIGLISLALLYFLNPFDVIPDLAPLIGFADDAAIFLSLFKSIQFDLQSYCRWKGYDTDLYF